MQSLFGIQLPQAAQYILAFAIVLALVAIFGVFLRRIAGGRLRMGATGSTRTRQPRLGIVDIYDLDRQRQLVLLRRDNTEHLLMIGGPNDVVVETNIVRGQARASLQPTAGEPEMVEPEPSTPATPAPAEPRLPELRMPELRSPPPLRSRPEPLPEPRVEPVAPPPAASAPPAMPVTQAAAAPAIAVPAARAPIPAVQPPAPPAPTVQPPIRREPSPAPAVMAGAAMTAPQMDRPAPPAVEPVKKPEPVAPAADIADPFDDMSRQMEQALKAPFEAARQKPELAVPEVSPPAAISPVEAETVRIEPPLREPVPEPASAPVKPSPARSEAPAEAPSEKAADNAPVVEAEPLILTELQNAIAEQIRPELAKAEPPKAEAAKPEPARKETPEPVPAPAATAAKDDPFSIEAIEAEFARLLGRTDQKSN